MFYIATAAWVVVALVNWVMGNRKMSLFTGVLGILAQVGIWQFQIGYFGIAALAFITLIGMFSVPEIFLGQR